jgi:hypothetical protein
VLGAAPGDPAVRRRACPADRRAGHRWGVRVGHREGPAHPGATRFVAASAVLIRRRDVA